ncbi:MAG: AGE family epimerase/isomerase [Lachnospiraceae bacterium]|nr:AGE family epimerase/isomerase [Lachnospiraceae bacterium]
MKKYEIDTNENKEFLKTLRNDLLSFGHRFPSENGSAYYLGDDGSPWMDRPRETWITCRMAHVYSMGEILGHKGSKQLAEDAIRGLLGELHDEQNGGWYAGVTKDGDPLPDKMCYAHAFVILAASSASLIHVGGADELLKQAIEVYDRYFWDEREGMAADTWNTEFTVLSDYRGINSNMHSVEAHLAAADVLKDERYRIRAGRIIDHVIKWAGENKWRIPEHFSKDWKPDLMLNRERPADPFKPFGATPGHGIEWARLIVQYALSAHRDQKKIREEYIEAASNLYDRAIRDGWFADGEPGICYTTDWEGKPVVHDRMHWTLAEAINSSAVLYRILGTERYAKDYAMFMQYLDEKVLDHEKGSWFHQLDQNNRLTGTVWPGKSDLYHAFQATLIPYSKDQAVSVTPALLL